MPKSIESCRLYARSVAFSRKLVLLSLILSLIVSGDTGCKPKVPAEPPSVSDAASADANGVDQKAGPASVTPPADLPRVNTASNGEPDMRDLNRYLLRWAVGHRRRPASFADFAADPGVQIPPAPAGEKYQLDTATMHIVLVKQ